MYDAFITCKYSCNLCGISNREVQVKAREKEENVIQWMENICIPTISRDHTKMSPHCHPETLSNLMIPISGADIVGGVIKQ